MRTRIYRFASALSIVTLGTVLVAQAPALDVKLGLWEVQSTTQISGQMPAVDTSKMSPEQKARFEEMMKSMAGAHSTTTKYCLTQEKLNQAVFLTGTSQQNANCKQTLTTNNKTTLEGTVVCGGQNATGGQLHIEALSPTSIKATMNGSGTTQGRTTTMNATMIGKWVSADCGDVK